MEIAAPRLGWRERPAGIRSLENWLLCWIVLPNVGFWLLWFIGGPPRGWPILITGGIGIALHRAPFAFKFAGFVAAMTYSTLYFISALFNLPVRSLVHSLKFAAELSPSSSAQYVFGGATLALTLGAAGWLLRRPTILAQPTHFAIAALATVVAGSVDGTMARDSVGSYYRVPDPDAPFTSAVRQSGIGELADGHRHVLLIMVEAMGEPADPAIRRQLIDMWARPEVRARYDVTEGHTPYYGSTTSGEMRELCGRWGDYQELIGRRDPSCLPARLAARGYHSQVWHSFKGSMFDRTQWYPNVGFTEMHFGPELMSAGAQGCPGVFPGACDRDVPRQIGSVLRRSRGPQFVYWLTVNSHLPVLSNAALRTEDCGAYDPNLNRDFPMICRLLELYEQTGAALAREITAADFPATDILIVGDHMPPFFNRRDRNAFLADRVPWILLRPRPHIQTAEAGS